MDQNLTRIWRWSDSSFRREEGAATVEAVLWIPFFFFLLILILDASMIFHNQTTITRILQDANRNLSVGRFDTEAETESFVLTKVGKLSPSATANTNITAGLISTTVSVPMADLTLLGSTSFASGNITVVASHLLEK